MTDIFKSADEPRPLKRVGDKLVVSVPSEIILIDCFGRSLVVRDGDEIEVAESGETYVNGALRLPAIEGA